jgi:NAD(P)-dependent dehydrogenase (short-subunit alcohol dehydrogenase family)
LAAASGWLTILIDKNKRALERLYDEIVRAGGVEPFLQILDLAAVGPDECDKLLLALESEAGGLDALVHCAVSFSGLQPLDLLEPNEWLNQLQVNLNAPWMLTVKCLPFLKKSPQASVLFLLDGQPKSKALWGAYGVSKAGLQALAEQFNAELKGSGICVHAVDPGPMRTSLRSSVFHSEHPASVRTPDQVAEQLVALL